jgi:predicted double-glycine peptidase
MKRAIWICLLTLAAPAGRRARAEDAAIWIDVPFAAQTRDACGSASMTMVMRYWDGKEGRPASPDSDPGRIQAALFYPPAGGIFASAMARYLRQAGYRAFAFPGQWDDLRRQLAQGRPLIVSLKASGRRGPLHYVVVVGVDSARGYVFVNDPARQKMLRISKEGFEAEWSGAGDWMLLAIPQAGD